MKARADNDDDDHDALSHAETSYDHIGTETQFNECVRILNTGEALGLGGRVTRSGQQSSANPNEPSDQEKPKEGSTKRKQKNQTPDTKKGKKKRIAQEDPKSPAKNKGTCPICGDKFTNERPGVACARCGRWVHVTTSTNTSTRSQAHQCCYGTGIYNCRACQMELGHLDE